MRLRRRLCSRWQHDEDLLIDCRRSRVVNSAKLPRMDPVAAGYLAARFDIGWQQVVPYGSCVICRTAQWGSLANLLNLLAKLKVIR
jgi:hypothetical protein